MGPDDPFVFNYWMEKQKRRKTFLDAARRSFGGGGGGGDGVRWVDWLVRADRKELSDK